MSEKKNVNKPIWPREPVVGEPWENVTDYGTTKFLILSVFEPNGFKPGDSTWTARAYSGQEQAFFSVSCGQGFNLRYEKNQPHPVGWVYNENKDGVRCWHDPKETKEEPKRAGGKALPA